MGSVRQTLVLQAVTLVLRPLCFIWCVATLRDVPWATGFLLTLGFLPLFSVLDIVCQSVSRHRHLVGAGVHPLARIWPWSAAVMLLLSSFLLLSGVDSANAMVLSAALIAACALASTAFFFEPTFSSPAGVWDLGAVELVGYLLCIALALLGQEVLAAVAMNAVFPMTRILVAIKHRAENARSRGGVREAGGQAKYVGSSVAAQLLASAAGTAPACLVAFSLADEAALAEALIYFKVLFVGASVFSVVVNLFSSRLFYGFLTLDLSSSADHIKRAESLFLTALSIFCLIASVCIAREFFSEFAAGGALLLAFAYLNIISSLALARGRPSISAASQVVVLLGSFGFALLLSGSVKAALGLLAASAAAFWVFQRRHRLIGLVVA